MERLGDVAVQNGSLREAKAHFSESLGIRRALAKADPSSAVAQVAMEFITAKLNDLEAARSK